MLHQFTLICVQCHQSFIVSKPSQAQSRRYCSKRCSERATAIPIEDRFSSKVNESGPIPLHRPEIGPCAVWTASCFPNGYGRLGIDGKVCYAHRVAWELANGPVPDGLFVLHACDNRSCVRLSHLHLGTTQDNQREMVERGRSTKGRPTKPEHIRRGDKSPWRLHPELVTRGEAHWNATLTESDVMNIRTRVANGTSRQRDIAREYGKSESAISRIVSRKIWAHI